MEKFKKVVHRRRAEGEVPTFRVAVRNHCLECCGYSPKEVELCQGEKCWLYPLRFGSYPVGYRARRGQQVNLLNNAPLSEEFQPPNDFDSEDDESPLEEPEEELDQKKPNLLSS